MINEADNISSRYVVLLVLFDVIYPDPSYRKKREPAEHHAPGIFPPHIYNNQKKSSTVELIDIVAFFPHDQQTQLIILPQCVQHNFLTTTSKSFPLLLKMDR